MLKKLLVALIACTFALGAYAQAPKSDTTKAEPAKPASKSAKAKPAKAKTKTEAQKDAKKEKTNGK